MSLLISILASAKEATLRSLPIILLAVFQSSPPRRRRLLLYNGRFCSRNFNPRLREGGDGKSASGCIISYRFQSSPPRRRRHNEVICYTLIKISILASAKEATIADSVIDSVHGISILASAKEATALITKIHLKHHISFRHTAHKSPFNVNYLFQ